MNDKKTEAEIDSLQENPVFSPDEAVTVNFSKSDTLVGQTLDGRFLIEKDLTDGGADAGGIGLVYLAKDLKLMGKETVVKILQKASIKNEDIIRKFQHEKEALIRLDHPNIVRILDSGELSDGNPFMVMEFIEGYSLRRKLRTDKKLDFETAAELIEAVGNALNAAHSKEILHRDIKPENIMLTPQEDGFERVRLIDFGIARVENAQLAPVTQIPRVIGTILYMAPEQLAGKLEQTPAIDIYAFGIVVYEMLTGKLPFQPNSIIEMFHLQKEGVKTPPRDLRPDLPEEAENIMLSALEFEAAKRPQNARTFGRDLANALRRSQEISLEDGRTITMEDDLTIPLPEAVNTRPSNVAGHPTPETIPTGIRDSEEILTIPQQQQPKKPYQPGMLAGLGVLILGIGAIAVGILLWKTFNSETTTPVAGNQAVNKDSPPETNRPTRKLTYYLEVHKMRNGQKFDKPFEASGREIFEKGYRYWFNFRADHLGYFYLFNEGRDKAGKVNFNINHPVPVNGKENALTEKDQTVKTEWAEFQGQTGTEKFWLIWTLEKHNILEDAVKEAFAHQGKVADPAKESALRRFLEENSKQKLNAELEKDDVKKRTNLTGTGDIIVHLIELEYK